MRRKKEFHNQGRELTDAIAMPIIWASESSAKFTGGPARPIHFQAARVLHPEEL